MYYLKLKNLQDTPSILISIPAPQISKNIKLFNLDYDINDRHSNLEPHYLSIVLTVKIYKE